MSQKVNSESNAKVENNNNFLLLIPARCVTYPLDSNWNTVSRIRR